MSEISVNKNDDDSISVQIPYIEGLNVDDNNFLLYRGRWEIGFYYDNLLLTVETLDSKDNWKCKFRFTAEVDISYLGDMVKIISDQINKLYQDNQISK